MKKSNFTCFMLIIISLFISDFVSAQRNEWVNQVIVVNGGKFESGPSPSDYVTVQSYNPNTQQTDVFGTIFTQSTQHVVIKDNFAYVAAQDSIIKYNIDTYQRIAAVKDSGLSKLYVYNNRLIVTKQWPIKRFFVEVLDAADLSLISRVQNISGDCGEAVVALDTVYVAVNEGFLGTEGKLAVIDPSNWTLKRQINFGPEAIGIWNLYNYNGYIWGVCRTPSGSTGVGNITMYDFFVNGFINVPLPVTLGEGYGTEDNILYVNMNYGIGTFDLLTQQIVDPELIPDPGYIDRIVISSAKVDYVNGLIYMNIGDMITFGRGVIATIAGDSIGHYTTGLNADAIAIDYRTPVGIESHSGPQAFSIYPNPVTNEMIIDIKDQSLIDKVIISDPAGKSYNCRFINSNRSIHINCSDLAKGLYFITIKSDKGSSTKKFIKE